MHCARVWSRRLLRRLRSNERSGTAEHPFAECTAPPKKREKKLGEDKMKTLRETKIGETVKVVRLHGEGAVKRRIMDMGVTKGTEVYVRKVAPLGDPIEVTVRGYELSLRKADAEMIEVE